MIIQNLGTIKLIDSANFPSGKAFPFHVDSVRQTKMYCEALGINHDNYYDSIFTISNGIDLTNKELTINFLWSALYAGAIRVNRECSFTYEDVVDWYEDEANAKEFVKVLNTLYEVIKKKTEQLVTAMKSVMENEKVLAEVMKTATVEQLEAIERLKKMMIS